MNPSPAGDLSRVLLPIFVMAMLPSTSSLALDLTNATTLTLPAFHEGPGPASAYPSVITVSGLTGTVARVSVTLRNISIERPDDIEVILAAPNGSSMVILGDAGGISPVNDITLTLDDLAGGAVPDAGPFTNGNFRPTSVNSSETAFPLPAPQPGYSQAAPGGSATFASIFNGLTPNGTWSLYVVDDVSSGASGMIAGGWSLSLLTSPPYNYLTAGTTNGIPLLQFTGFAGQIYYFQRATNVLGPYHDLFPDLTAEADGQLEYLDTTASALPERYYRVRTAP